MGIPKVQQTAAWQAGQKGSQLWRTLQHADAVAPQLQHLQLPKALQALYRGDLVACCVQLSQLGAAQRGQRRQRAHLRGGRQTAAGNTAGSGVLQRSSST